MGFAVERPARNCLQNTLPRLSICLLLCSADAFWVPLPRLSPGEVDAVAPTARYGHASVCTPHELWITGGYRNLAAAEPQPLWMSDVWQLDAGAGAWQEAMPAGSGPSPRLGHSLSPLLPHTRKQRLLLHGGDDGGRKRSMWGATYIPQQLNDSWILSTSSTSGIKGSEWQPLSLAHGSQPAPSLSLHACVALPVPDQPASSLCFGGLTPGANGPVDSDALWIVTVVETTNMNGAAAAAATAMRWTQLQQQEGSSTASVWPHARHGHSMSLFSRAVLLPDGSVAMEHAAYLFGGAASRCDGAALSQQQASLSPYVTVSAMHSGSGSREQQEYRCTFCDLWRYVWLEQQGVKSGSWQRITAAVAASAAASAGAGSGKGKLAELVAAVQAASTERDAACAGSAPTAVTADSWPDSWPSPRVHGGLAPLASGLLLFGGGLCTPGCTCNADTWLLRISPVGIATDVGAASVSACEVGLSWQRQYGGGASRLTTPQRRLITNMLQAVTHASPAPSDEEGGREQLTGSWWEHAELQRTLQPQGLRQWLQQRTGAAAAAAAPPPRFRHSLSAPAGMQQQLAQLHATAVQETMSRWLAGELPAAAAASALLQLWPSHLPLSVQRLLASSSDCTSSNAGLQPAGEPSASEARGVAYLRLLLLSSTAVLFGGESYFPSAYYSDAWLWWDASIVTAAARGVTKQAQLVCGGGTTALEELSSTWSVPAQIAAGLLLLCTAVGGAWALAAALAATRRHCSRSRRKFAP